MLEMLKIVESVYASLLQFVDWYLIYYERVVLIIN